jgi:splicing factor 1
MKIIPNYHPPSDYRRPTKTQEKVYVPVNDYPEINFSMLTNPLTLFYCFALPFMLRSLLLALQVVNSSSPVLTPYLLPLL